MLSREAYRIIHQIDGNKDDFTRMMNWRHIKDDDPRLKRLRRVLEMQTTRTVERTIPNHEKIQRENIIIEEMLEKCVPVAEIAEHLGITFQTIYSRIRKSKQLSLAYAKAKADIQKVVLVKDNKAQIFKDNKEAAGMIGGDAHTVSVIKYRHTTYKGFRVYRYLDWRKRYE